MKAEMKMSGTLVISAENSLEAYALRTWHEENAAKLPDKLIVDHSLSIVASSSAAGSPLGQLTQFHNAGWKVGASE